VAGAARRTAAPIHCALDAPPAAVSTAASGGAAVRGSAQPRGR
jgi:hypothetical protein